jgi:hypothetical protein
MDVNQLMNVLQCTFEHILQYLHLWCTPYDNQRLEGIISKMKSFFLMSAF